MNLLKTGFLFFIVLFFATTAKGQDMPVANNGILDARQYDFSTNKPLKLNGEWKFFEDELLTPSTSKVQAGYTQLPEPWSGSQGVATYSLEIIVNQNSGGYSLELPQMYSSYQLWANGERVAANGMPGSTRSSTKPKWLPQLVTLHTASDTLSLVLQVANFTHATGGLKNPLLLGLTEDLSAKRKLAEWVNKILLGILLVSGSFFTAFYFFIKKEKSVLFFALMCLVWAIRSVFSELYLIVQWFPDLDWELLVKVEYITIYLEVCFGMLFLSRLYPLDTQKVIVNPILYSNYLFLLLTMATPAIVYTRFLNVYLAVAGFAILYAAFVMIRAILFDRYGARWSVMAIISCAAAFGYNMLSFLGLFEFNPVIYHACYVVAFAFIGIALAYQLSPKAVKKNVKEKLTLDDFISPN